MLQTEESDKFQNYEQIIIDFYKINSYYNPQLVVIER